MESFDFLIFFSVTTYYNKKFKKILSHYTTLHYISLYYIILYYTIFYSTIQPILTFLCANRDRELFYSISIISSFCYAFFVCLYICTVPTSYLNYFRQMIKKEAIVVSLLISCESISVKNSVSSFFATNKYVNRLYSRSININLSTKILLI